MILWYRGVLSSEREKRRSSSLGEFKVSVIGKTRNPQLSLEGLQQESNGLPINYIYKAALSSNKM